MEKYTQIIGLANELIEGNTALEKRFTKAESARQRKKINEIQKLAVEAKRELMAKDKEA